MQNFLRSLMFSLMVGCSSTGGYMKTVDKVDIGRFMGDWYVLAGRFTFLEKEVHNGVEKYTWNEAEKRIDIEFDFNKGSLDGKKRSIPQKGWIENHATNAHWKVSPMWPLKFDYLIIALDEGYRWTAVGVPDQKYLWIMARDSRDALRVIEEAVRRLKQSGYNTENLVTVPHSLR
jgi:apolipoprotein D and lipocalin family protein